MPVTFSPFPEKEISPTSRRLASLTASSLLAVNKLQSSEPKPKPVVKILQSTFGRGNAAIRTPLVPLEHGLVHTVLEAYNQHHALVLRPDDIWLAILSQFSLFVNGKDKSGTPRAERLRQCFVAHEGKRKLSVTMTGNRYSVDFGLFANLMVKEIDQAVVDPTLKKWMVPSFSTTTPNDLVVASVMVMASLKSYFDYKFCLACGIPQITLEGTREDWLDIFRRTNKLVEYGPEAAAWRDLLRPVLVRFVRSFDKGWAESKEGREFWQRIVHYKRGGSGPSFLSGWITAFCTFDDEGICLAQLNDPEAAMESKAGGVYDPELDYTFGTIAVHSESYYGQSLKMDDVQYHRVDTGSIPSACAEVDVLLNDNGKEFNTVMVAGLVGMSVKSARDERKSNGLIVKKGEVAPVAAWWMYITKSRSLKQSFRSPPTRNSLRTQDQEQRQQADANDKVERRKPTVSMGWWSRIKKW
jgi:hypothetical protein